MTQSSDKMRPYLETMIKAALGNGDASQRVSQLRSLGTLAEFYGFIDLGAEIARELEDAEEVARTKEASINTNTSSENLSLPEASLSDFMKGLDTILEDLKFLTGPTKTAILNSGSKFYTSVLAQDNTLIPPVKTALNLASPNPTTPTSAKDIDSMLTYLRNPENNALKEGANFSNEVSKGISEIRNVNGVKLRYTDLDPDRKAEIDTLNKLVEPAKVLATAQVKMAVNEQIKGIIADGPKKDEGIDTEDYAKKFLNQRKKKMVEMLDEQRESPQNGPTLPPRGGSRY